jgi:hypothetical protein
MENNKKIISNNLINNLPFLEKLILLNPNARKVVLKDKNIGENIDLFNALQEISHNTLKGNVKLNKIQKEKVKRQKHILLKFCCGKVKKSKNKRQKIISQSGKLWPILIPIVAAIVSELIKNV